MKKIFAILMTAAMLLSLGAVVASAELPPVSWTAGTFLNDNAENFQPVGDINVTWDAKASEKLDVNDGDMSDWAAAGYNMITIDYNNMVEWASSDKADANQWGMSTYFVADNDYLYIGFFITDPDVVLSDAGQYNGDAFQVCIDFGGKLGEVVRTDPDRLSNPKNIFYSFGVQAEGVAPIEITRQESDNNGVLTEANGDGVKGSTCLTDEGWCAEFALSWQMLYDDYVWKAWEEDPKLYIGGDEDRPMLTGCCLYYLNRDANSGGWHGATTNGIVDDNGVPQISWTAYDNSINLVLTYQDDMAFNCSGIVAIAKTETIPPETEPPVTEAPETEAPKATEAPETEAPKATEAPETDAAAATTAAADDAAATTAATTEEGGCASVIGMGAVAVLAAAAAVVALKKKD